MAGKYKKRYQVCADKATEELVDLILKVGGAESVSGLFRQMVRREAARLNLSDGTESSDSSFQVNSSASNVDEIEKLHKRLSECIAICKETDDKTYVLLDAFNSFLKYIEPEQSVKYKSMDDKINPINSQNEHIFIQSSKESLKQRKHNAKMSKK